MQTDQRCKNLSSHAELSPEEILFRINNISGNSLAEICSYLTLDELSGAAKVSKRFRKTIKRQCLYPKLTPTSYGELLGALELLDNVEKVSLSSHLGTGTCQSWVRPRHLKAIGSAFCQKLRGLDLGLWHETKHSPNAHKFVVTSVELTGLWSLRCPLKCLVRNTRGIKKFKMLRRLALGSSGCSSQMVSNVVDYLGDMPNLRWLFIQTHFDEGLALSLKRCPNLRRLSFGGEGMSDSAAKHIGGLARLEYLDASGCDSRHMNPTCLSDGGLRCLRGLSNLKFLNLYGNHQLTDRGLASAIRTFDKLETLCIGSPSVDDKTLEALFAYGHFPSLKALGLQGSSIGEKGLSFLHRISHLEKLDISFCYRVTNGSLRHILQLIERGVNVNFLETGLTPSGWTKAMTALGNSVCLEDDDTWTSMGMSERFVSV